MRPSERTIRKLEKAKRFAMNGCVCGGIEDPDTETGHDPLCPFHIKTEERRRRKEQNIVQLLNQTIFQTFLIDGTPYRRTIGSNGTVNWDRETAGGYVGVPNFEIVQLEKIISKSCDDITGEKQARAINRESIRNIYQVLKGQEPGPFRTKLLLEFLKLFLNMVKEYWIGEQKILARYLLALISNEKIDEFEK